jgi:hypothetical protein
MIKSIVNVARQVVYLKRNLPTLLYWTYKLRKDPSFNLNTIDGGLRPRSSGTDSLTNSRIEAARRIIAAYKKADSDLLTKSACYKVSNEWIPIFRKPLQPLILALEVGDPVALSKLLDNFFRNSLSVGLCGLTSDMEGDFFTKVPSIYNRWRLLVDSLYRYRLTEKLLPGVKTSDMYIPDVGNPYGINIDEGFLRNGVDYQYYYAKLVSKLISNDSKRARVVELGGGIGGFAYFLGKLQNNMTYINFDLPEILCISAYQLLNLYPEKKILLYGEVAELTDEALNSYDMALLPSFCIELISEDSTNVSFNSYSLAEMDSKSIENYVFHLGRVSKDAILHVNHVKKAVVGADQFGFDEEKFVLTQRTRALWNLGRNLNCDEYEFLFRRRIIESES